MSKILFIASVPYPNGWAASARIRNLVEGFRSNSWEAEVLIFGRPEIESMPSMAPHVKWCIPDIRGGRLGQQYAYYLAPRALAKQIAVEPDFDDYDYIYLYARAFSVVSPLVHAFRRRKIPVIVDVNEAHSHFSGLGGVLSPNYWNSYFGYRFGILKADYIACISKELMHFYTNLGGHPLLLPSVEFYDQEPKKFSANPITFLYSGSFYERDSPNVMLDLVEELIRRGLKLRFCVAGPYDHSPQAVQYLERIQSSHYLKSHTSLLGRLPEQEYSELRQAADFGFILRRDHHAERASFPTRLVEYIKHGVIPITSDVPDIPDYLEHDKDAVILQNNDLDKTTEYLTQLCHNNERMRCMMVQAYEAGKRHFCAKKNVARIIQHLHG